MSSVGVYKIVVGCMISDIVEERGPQTFRVSSSASVIFSCPSSVRGLMCSAKSCVKNVCF